MIERSLTVCIDDIDTLTDQELAGMSAPVSAALVAEMSESTRWRYDLRSRSWITSEAQRTRTTADSEAAP